MNPSYCRIRIAKDEALLRFAAWNGLPVVGPLVATTSMHAVELACDESGQWSGRAVFISENAGWTLFEDLSGGLSAIPGRRWLDLAGSDDLLFAGYNDAIGYGELVVVRDRQVVRWFLEDEQSPEGNVDQGNLGDETEPLDWVAVASFVDGDELAFSEEGWLWVY